MAFLQYIYTILISNACIRPYMSSASTNRLHTREGAPRGSISHPLRLPLRNRSQSWALRMSKWKGERKSDGRVGTYPSMLGGGESGRAELYLSQRLHRDCRDPQEIIFSTALCSSVRHRPRVCWWVVVIWLSRKIGWDVAVATKCWQNEAAPGWMHVKFLVE